MREVRRALNTTKRNEERNQTQSRFFRVSGRDIGVQFFDSGTVIQAKIIDVL